MIKKEKQLKIEHSIKRNARSAEMGLKLFRSIVGRISWGDYVFLFPSADRDVNYFGLLYLDEFLLRRNMKKAIIITSDILTSKSAEFISTKVKRVCLISSDQMKTMLNLFNMVYFADIVIVGLDEVEGRMGSSLIGVNGITKEMAVAIGIYFLIPFVPQTPKLSYIGMSPEMKEFINRGNYGY